MITTTDLTAEEHEVLSLLRRLPAEPRGAMLELGAALSADATDTTPATRDQLLAATERVMALLTAADARLPLAQGHPTVKSMRRMLQDLRDFRASGAPRSFRISPVERETLRLLRALPEDLRGLMLELGEALGADSSDSTPTTRDRVRGAINALIARGVKVPAELYPPAEAQ
ncbi:MAG: hypothetical protein KC503_36850 [Myxococcales bacterium]|nr:hypothetical protein [Myxococcales bacterium]